MTCVSEYTLPNNKPRQIYTRFSSQSDVELNPNLSHWIFNSDTVWQRINNLTVSSFLIIVSANLPAAGDAWARQMEDGNYMDSLGNLKEKCWLKNS